MTDAAPNGNGRKVRFEGKITLGTVIQVALIIGGGIYALAVQQANLGSLTKNFDEFKGEVWHRFDNVDAALNGKMDRLPTGTAIYPPTQPPTKPPP